MSALPLALRATVEDCGSGPGYAVVRACLMSEEGERVTGASMRIWGAGWPGDTQLTEPREDGAAACEFGPLGAGRYTVETITPSGSCRADVQVGANQVVSVRFEPAGRGSKNAGIEATGRITGRVTNGEGVCIRVTGPGVDLEQIVTGDNYVIGGLPAGEYRISLLRPPLWNEEVVVVERITVGGGAVRVDLMLPVAAPGRSG